MHFNVPALTRAQQTILGMLLVVGLIAIGLVIATPAAAQEQPPFEVDLATTYRVGTDSQTQVEHRFIITNTTPTQYLTEYGLRVHFSDLSQVQVLSGAQQLEFSLLPDEASTEIRIVFPDQIVGQNNQREFAIRYTTGTIATAAGKVLEVQIPQIRSNESYSQNSILLYTPLQYGRATRVTPDPSTVVVQDQEILTTFSEDATESISALFGEQQIFNLTLRYNLENNSSNPGLAQIALPPDTSYQRMHYHSLEPYAQEIKVDEDGNWIATYALAPHSATTVHLTASVRVSLEPQSNIPVIPPGAQHTEPKRYWDSDHSRIKKLAAEHNSLRASYDFVVSQLQYDYTSLNQNGITQRLGSVGALDRPELAVCQEFTDVFIALARAQGVSARRLTGFAYTENATQRPVNFDQDVLHAWPEYYDTELNVWKQVDPTWEHTTGGIDYFDQFDLNHIVFAINGESSTAPYPAGSYKTDENDSKDIEIGFADTFPNPAFLAAANIVPYEVFGRAVPGRYIVRIENQTGLAWYDQRLELQTTTDSTVEPRSITVSQLLPYQTVEIPVQIIDTQLTAWQFQTPSTLKYQLHSPNDESALLEDSFEITAGHRYFKTISEDSVALLLGGLIIFGTFGTGGLLVFRQQRKRTLRR
ncbi:MAG: transglutaminase-like domain-containing protein [Patescibacteria group bacterium]